VENVGKIAIITGANRGIGRAIALRLLNSGIKVSLICRDVEACTEIQNRYQNNSLIIKADLHKKDDIARAVKLTIKKFGSLNILVNNAGICNVSEFIKTKDKVWDDTFSVNVKSIYYFCKIVIPLMKEYGGGKIINIASQAGIQGEAYNSIYSASKFAVIGLTQSLAKEFGKDNIQINSLCPGATDTLMLKQAIDEFAKIHSTTSEIYMANLLSNIPAGRMATPDEIANAVLFLTSNTSDFINGASIGITGGETVF
jgi:meso-butanediol dehydrogenase / (S,S)-butanediol dehydrogenase / diacetyl reductase